MKTCVITGVGAGIGKATAIKLSYSKLFDNYALIGRNLKEIEATRKDMAESVDQEHIKEYSIDLVSPEQIPDIIKRIYQDFESIDCLLNIAGYTDPQPLLSTTLESFEQTYKINVF